MSVESHFESLAQGCVDIVRRDELRQKLERSNQTGDPLVVKVGFDPTAPDLHLGHTVLIRKMKQFQDLGHTVVYVVGDFTARIGDPTGRSKTRPALSTEKIKENAETYRQQIFKILDPKATTTRFNSEWLDPLGSDGWIRLAARYNVARMLERRDFKQRYEEGQPIGIHEFLYPLAQAYDSVILKADVELGGTDQLFNLNVGRDIMLGFGLEPQVVMTTPLLEGLDGVEKMSKSLGNYVGVTERPEEMFGKLMSISDELMWKYYALLTDFTETEIIALRVPSPQNTKTALEGLQRALEKSHAPDSADAVQALRKALLDTQESNETQRAVELALNGLRLSQGLPLEPKMVDTGRRASEMRAKLLLAETTVKQFHGSAAAVAARHSFESIFVKRESSEIPAYELRAAPDASARHLLVKAGLASSMSDATRKFQQGAVREELTDNGDIVVRVGRRALKFQQYSWMNSAYQTASNTPGWEQLSLLERALRLREAVLAEHMKYGRPADHLENIKNWPQEFWERAVVGLWENLGSS